MCTSRLNGKIRSAQRWTYVLANSALLLESTGAAAHEIAAPRDSRHWVLSDVSLQSYAATWEEHEGFRKTLKSAAKVTLANADRNESSRVAARSLLGAGS